MPLRRRSSLGAQLVLREIRLVGQDEAQRLLS
jgi:hypothetical protein